MCGEWCGDKQKPSRLDNRKGLIFMVRSARFELTAFGSGGQRSIQLSYERIRTFLICFVLAAVKVSGQWRSRAQHLKPADEATPRVDVNSGSLRRRPSKHLCQASLTINPLHGVYGLAGHCGRQCGFAHRRNVG